MSNKSAKPSKKLSVPRTMAEIQKVYQELSMRAGQVQYQVKVYSSELDAINEQLLRINNEAAARQKLDIEEKAKLAANGTETAVQNA